MSEPLMASPKIRPTSRNHRPIHSYQRIRLITGGCAGGVERPCHSHHFRLKCRTKPRPMHQSAQAEKVRNRTAPALLLPCIQRENARASARYTRQPRRSDVRRICRSGSRPGTSGA